MGWGAGMRRCQGDHVMGAMSTRFGAAMLGSGFAVVALGLSMPASADSGSDQTVAYCHEGSRNSTSYRNFWEGGHPIENLRPDQHPKHAEFGHDIYPAGSYVEPDGTVISWAAHGDQGVLANDCKP